jgi:hypothetical protein
LRDYVLVRFGKQAISPLKSDLRRGGAGLHLNENLGAINVQLTPADLLEIVHFVLFFFPKIGSERESGKTCILRDILRSAHFGLDGCQIGPPEQPSPPKDNFHGSFLV